MSKNTQNYPKTVLFMNFKFSQKQLLFLVLFLLSTSLMYGNMITTKPSGKVYNGYIIMVSGDTLHGKLQMLSPTMNQVKVKFIDNEGKKLTYKAKDIDTYAFQIQEWDKNVKQNVAKWIFYTKKTVERPPVPFGPTEVLLQTEISGIISTYNFYIETRTNQNIEHLIYIEKEGILYEISKANYRKLLKALFADCPKVHSKIGRKGYTYNSVDLLINEYNNEMSQTEEATISYDKTED